MIKLVAVDMDGTFLRSDKTYDRKLFKKIFQQMELDDVKFVVASGNQYYQLKTFFDEAAKIPFVAENGGLVMDGQEEVFIADVSHDLVKKVLKILQNYGGVSTLLCGRKNAYYTTENKKLIAYISQYYYHMKHVDSFEPLPNDCFLKLTNVVEDGNKAAELTKILAEELKETMIPVNSGHQDIDIILPGMNKAHGLKLLGEKYQISPEEMIAFGDAGNDLEMLKFVGHGFAMENAQPAVKEIAAKVIGLNDEDAVLATLQDFIDNKWEYPYN